MYDEIKMTINQNISFRLSLRSQYSKYRGVLLNIICCKPQTSRSEAVGRRMKTEER